MSKDHFIINLSCLTIHEESFKNVTIPLATMYSNIPMKPEHIHQWIESTPMDTCIFHPRIPVVSESALHSTDALLKVTKTAQTKVKNASIIADISILIFRREIDIDGHPRKREYDSRKWDTRETYEHYARLHTEIPRIIREESAVYGVHPNIEATVHKILFAHHDDFAAMCRMFDLFGLDAFTDKRTLMFKALINMTIQRDRVPSGVGICAPKIMSGGKNMCALCCKAGATVECGCGVFYCGNGECRRKDWPRHRMVHHIDTDAKGCASCGYEANMKCSVCKRARYCCKECQNTHWPDHKMECGRK